MEKPQVRVRKYHSMLIRCLHALLIHNTATRRRQVLHAAPPRAIYVVREGEERVAAARHAIQLSRPLFLLLSGKWRGHLLELRLPLLLLPATALEHFARDKQVYCVSLLRALHALLEWECEDTRVVSEPPQVSLRACETRAVNAGLLSGADANDSAMVRIGNAVGLCVLQR